MIDFSRPETSKGFFASIREKHFRKLLFLSWAILLPLIYFLAMPDLSKLRSENPQKTSYMKYQEREWKKKGKTLRIDQRWVPLSAISPTLVRAVLIAEDDKFWSHEGFDTEAIKKAIEKDIKARKFKLGGSTISQQLAKNLYLTPVKHPIRKIQEAIITWGMERVLSKKRILELYLNVAEWGEGIYGIEAASRHYFGKPSSELTAAESTRLAAVLPNPRRYDPTGNQPYVVYRSDLIYDIMVRRGIVIPEYQEGIEENGLSRDEETDPVSSDPHEGSNPSE